MTPPKKTLDLPWAIRLYREGRSLREIGQILGIAPQTVGRRFAEAGEPMRGLERTPLQRRRSGDRQRAVLGLFTILGDGFFNVGKAHPVDI